ncbi:MAG: transglutaminaseTgpA domain-containing protein, partial [Demequina sp.]|uniref:transglutaminaseTgpA domain-containing protein n=1 Tax=Demequina sp. TaxID=2050685 RepID=UPI003A88CC24
MSRQAGPTPWAVTPIVAVATYAGVFALEPMVVTGPWLWTLAAVLAGVCAVVVAARLLSRSRFLPTVVGLVAALLGVVALFSRDASGARHLLPTPRALADLGSTLRAGVDYAATTVAPAEVTEALLSIICACLLLMFLVAEHIAASWRAAASAGLVLMLPWLPAAIFQQRVPIVWLFVALGAWLLSLAVSRRGEPSAPPSSTMGAVAATTATLGLALLVVPSALGGNGWGMIPRFNAPSALDSTTRLNLDLDLRTSLTTHSTAPAIVYSADGARPEVFRLYALGEFDGVSWARAETDADALEPTDGVLWPVDTGEPSSTSATYTIETVGLAETNLPLPAAPRTVEAEGAWSYDPSVDEVVGDDESTLGLTYTVTADTGYLTAERLAASPAEAGSEADAAVGAQDLEIPPAMDAARVADLATSLTTEATTRFGQAVLIQDYLRDPSEFDYDTSVSPTSRDAVSAFLDSRAGYCVQFAT